MPKVKKVPIGNKEEYQWHIYCLGCKQVHALSPAVHHFNYDTERPTFSPSLLQDWDPKKICHSYIFEGYIRYLSDCSHDLRNKTVELPEIL
jgi:hypothetical protein